MSYSVNLDIMKRGVIDRTIQENPDTSFEEIWSSYLFAWTYPDEYNIPDGEAARGLYWTYHHMFRKIEILGGKYDDARMIEHDTFNEVCNIIKEKLESMTLLDLANLGDTDESDELIALVDAYRSLMTAEINWDEEVVVYSCG